MKTSFKKITVLILIIISVLLIKNTKFGNHLTFENLKNNKEYLNSFVKQNYLSSVFLYIIIYILVVSLSIPGAAILTLAAGYLFGITPGAIYVNFGATTGAGLAFLFTRYILGEWMQKTYQDKLAKFNNEIKTNGYSYLLMMRLLPVFPFFLINILAALTTIPFITFIWTTSVGIIPGSLVYVSAGSQLNTISSLKDIVSLKILFTFIVLMLFVLIPIIRNKVKARKTENLLN
ncbi:TVP38/TMEM64 family protein [Candidatus Desantisbacteria bacterium]|nr:TVP38/TMEM64 family protein [Candidatus Desantisbacteria bacterium]